MLAWILFFLGVVLWRRAVEALAMRLPPRFGGGRASLRARWLATLKEGVPAAVLVATVLAGDRPIEWKLLGLLVGLIVVVWHFWSPQPAAAARAAEEAHLLPLGDGRIRSGSVRASGRELRVELELFDTDRDYQVVRIPMRVGDSRPPDLGWGERAAPVHPEARAWFEGAEARRLLDQSRDARIVSGAVELLLRPPYTADRLAAVIQRLTGLATALLDSAVGARERLMSEILLDRGGARDAWLGLAVLHPDTVRELAASGAVPRGDDAVAAAVATAVGDVVVLERILCGSKDVVAIERVRDWAWGPTGAAFPDRARLARAALGRLTGPDDGLRSAVQGAAEALVDLAVLGDVAFVAEDPAQEPALRSWARGLLGRLRREHSEHGGSLAIPAGDAGGLALAEGGGRVAVVERPGPSTTTAMAPARPLTPSSAPLPPSAGSGEREC